MPDRAGRTRGQRDDIYVRVSMRGELTLDEPRRLVEFTRYLDADGLRPVQIISARKPDAHRPAFPTLAP
jgi:hypothetical protein